MAENPAPKPLDGDDQERWAESGRRYDILHGCWQEHAEARHDELFTEEVRTFLPPAETSRNALLCYHQQLAIAYDETPQVVASEDGVTVEPEDLAPIVYDGMWQVLQDNCLYVSAINESVVRLDVDPKSDPDHVVYRVVPTDRVVMWALPENPGVPVGCSELRERVRPEDGKPEWTWETWDVSGETAVFKIESMSDGRSVDRTAAYGTGAYPYIDKASDAIFPYVLYHRFQTRQLWSPYRGAELVWGTLTIAALWTLWLSGVRDGAHPQRYVIDGKVVGGKVVKQINGVTPIEQAVGNPMALLQIESTGTGRTASVGQYQPAMDPKSAAEAIESYEAGLATYAGLNPSDVSRGSQGASGYAIVVSRDGQRRAVAKLLPGLRAGDTALFATGARLANAYLGTALPESPDAYSIQYRTMPETTEERKAKLEEAKALMDLGLMSKVEAYRLFHPGVDDEAARVALADIEAEDDGTPEPSNPASTADESTDTET